MTLEQAAAVGEIVVELAARPGDARATTFGVRVDSRKRA
jgi:hypothetical protein